MRPVKYSLGQDATIVSKGTGREVITISLFCEIGHMRKTPRNDVGFREASVVFQGNIKIQPFPLHPKRS